jgi:hypothetical protein
MQQLTKGRGGLDCNGDEKLGGTSIAEENGNRGRGEGAKLI